MSGSSDWSYNRFDKFEEQIKEGSCNTKGYQEGGEVKCEKDECKHCEGKGCEKCEDKKEKEEVKEGAKPDYLDLDKDGNKEESMKKAASEKADAHAMKTFQKLQKNVDQKRKAAKSLKKEELEATGLFTAEEIEQIQEVLGLGKH